MARATLGSRDPVVRALLVLEVLAREGNDLGVTDIGQKVGLNKSTTYRMLQSLIAAGFARPGQVEGTYRASIKLCELGSFVLERTEIREEAAPFLKKLGEITGEAVHLVVREDTHGVYIDKVESTHVMRMYSRVGRRVPLYCTGVGKVLMAGLPEEKRQEVVAATLEAYDYAQFAPNTKTNITDVMNDVAHVSDQGYALDREEHEQGVVCVAAPIRNHEGMVVAACSVSAPIFRVNDDQVDDIVAAVLSTCNDISKCLGYVTPTVLVNS